MYEDNDIRIAILRKLWKHRYIGARHTSFDNLPKGFPQHNKKEVKKIAKKLIKARYLISKPTSYGLEVSLNPKMLEEIKKIIKDQVL
ncbi:MAG: hypothetical protein ACE5KE_12685 [Methanosarcinales archaeon]